MVTKNQTDNHRRAGQTRAHHHAEFDAPRELVFRAYTDAEMYVQWLGPRRLTMKLPKFEPRDGGSYRFVHVDTDGTEYGFHGV